MRCTNSDWFLTRKHLPCGCQETMESKPCFSASSSTLCSLTGNADSVPRPLNRWGNKFPVPKLVGIWNSSGTKSEAWSLYEHSSWSLELARKEASLASSTRLLLYSMVLIRKINLEDVSMVYVRFFQNDDRGFTYLLILLAASNSLTAFRFGCSSPEFSRQLGKDGARVDKDYCFEAL